MELWKLVLNETEFQLFEDLRPWNGPASFFETFHNSQYR
jgi:hypothetical protein